MILPHSLFDNYYKIVVDRVSDNSCKYHISDIHDSVEIEIDDYNKDSCSKDNYYAIRFTFNKENKYGTSIKKKETIQKNHPNKTN